MKKTLAAAILASLAAPACGPSTPASSGCKDKMIAGDLVITEVFADYAAPEGGTSGVDDGREWFEIYNASGAPIELQGLTIVSSRPDGTKDHKHVMKAATIGPEQFFVLGSGDDEIGLPAYMNYGYGTDLSDLFNTDGGLLTLKCGSDEVDAAQYAGVKSGHSRELSKASPPDYTRNDDLAQWCQGNDSEFDPGNFGTPGEDNDCAPVVVGQCNDGGTMRDAIAPMPGDLVITEIMQKPKTPLSAANGQWFEAKAMVDLDLNGVGIDRANDATNPKIIESADCVHINAGEYVVFARNIDPLMNGGITAIAELPYSLSPTGNMPDVQLVYGSTVIDNVAWTTSTAGKSLSLSPDFTDAASNDTIGNFCDGQDMYEPGGSLGTPGMPNPACPMSVGPGQCLEGGVPRAINKPPAGALVITEALPRPGDGMTPVGEKTADEWVEILNTGAAPFDLNELTVKGAGATTNDILGSTCITVAPQGYAVLAHSNNAASNGGLPAVAATFTLTISSEFTISDGATILDRAAWGTSGTGTNQSKYDLSRQLKLANTNITDNDTAANYCDGQPAQTYGTGGHFGTPGVANVCP